MIKLHRSNSDQDFGLHTCDLSYLRFVHSVDFARDFVAMRTKRHSNLNMSYMRLIHCWMQRTWQQQTSPTFNLSIYHSTIYISIYLTINVRQPFSSSLPLTLSHSTMMTCDTIVCHPSHYLSIHFYLFCTR